MPFQYSCFMSYRRDLGEMGETFLDELCRAIDNEAKSYFEGEKIFRDSEELAGGDFFDERIASALCCSLCMIVVYVPKYFSPNNTYCAREYMAMERVEAMRFAALANRRRTHGFIIPIVLRGPEHLPKSIRQRRHYYDFSKFSLADPQISRHPEFANAIKELAEHIYSLYRQFGSVKPDLCGGCDSFALPSEAECKQWLGSVLDDHSEQWPEFPH
jgi:hypothetical protein